MKKISAYILFLIFIFINRGFSQDTVAVISPNGGESWVADSAHTIRWSDNFDPQVKIELFKGGVFHSLIKASTISNGVYEWEINKGIPSDSDYTVKISNTVNSNVFDFSDENFTIIANEVTVISPNGGEDWKAGTTQTIIWTDNFDENVAIVLFKGGVFQFSLPGGISTPSDGSFNWTIPFDITGGSDYSIRIASVQNSSVVFDNSDSNFTIIFNGIIVTSPNGGEIWEAGTRNTITWTDVINEAVQIDLYKSNTLYSPISPSTTSDGAFSWNIPTQTEAGSDYKIMMKSTINDNIFDISDNSFSIIGSEITVISPNGFENWMMGSTQEIIWSSTNVENVKIELSLTEGMSWETIVDSISNIGFYSWVINTSMPSFYCLIRISDIIDENIFDISDDVFIIDIFTSVEDYFGNGIPTEYNLIQNFPNPFNPSTTIYYGLPEESAVKINIYGVLGNEVMVYSEDKQEAGYHRVEFDASGLPSGIYFYRMQAGKFIETKKMILLK